MLAKGAKSYAGCVRPSLRQTLGRMPQSRAAHHSSSARAYGDIIISAPPVGMTMQALPKGNLTALRCPQEKLWGKVYNVVSGDC